MSGTCYTLLYFLFPLEAKIPFLLLPLEVRILDIIPILPFHGLFPSVRGAEGLGFLLRNSEE